MVADIGLSLSDQEQTYRKLQRPSRQRRRSGALNVCVVWYGNRLPVPLVKSHLVLVCKMILGHLWFEIFPECCEISYPLCRNVSFVFIVPSDYMFPLSTHSLLCVIIWFGHGTFCCFFTYICASLPLKTKFNLMQNPVYRLHPSSIPTNQNGTMAKVDCSAKLSLSAECVCSLKNSTDKCSDCQHWQHSARHLSAGTVADQP